MSETIKEEEKVVHCRDCKYHGTTWYACSGVFGKRLADTCDCGYTHELMPPFVRKCKYFEKTTSPIPREKT